MKIPIKKKYLYPALGIIGLLIVLMLVNTKDSDVEYIYGKAEKSVIVKTVPISGRLELGSSYMVKAATSGTVTKTYGSLYGPVKKGALLAEIYTPDSVYNYKQSNENLIRTKIDLNIARQVLVAKTELLKENLISKSQYQEAETNVQKAQSMYNSNLLTFTMYEKECQGQKVYAPESGILFQIMAGPGLSVVKGADLFQITTDIHQLVLIISVNETDIGYVKKEQTVEFQVSAFPQKWFAGQITFIYMNPLRDGNIITYQANVTCDNSERLLFPGMSASGSIKVARKERAFSVQNEAFFISPVPVEKKLNEHILWLKMGDAFKKITVDIGLMGDSRTEIIGNKVQEGDKVLIAVQRKKKKGLKIIE